jgi:hypothetical protein
MKAQILSLMILTMIAGAASAEVSERKPVTKIDFNNMIDANNKTRDELKEGIDESAAQAALEEKAEKTKVIDFIDVEVGWGEAPPVVDRRFDSVERNARKYEMNDQDLAPKATEDESGT